MSRKPPHRPKTDSDTPAPTPRTCGSYEEPILYMKHPPVSGGKRPLCTLGVPPGRSRGIGGCARAPCVFLAAAEGTA
eukprot:scaffold43714_cov54-Phaeocystis_antarctica.AAC.1